MRRLTIEESEETFGPAIKYVHTGGYRAFEFDDGIRIRAHAWFLHTQLRWKVGTDAFVNGTHYICPYTEYDEDYPAEFLFDDVPTDQEYVECARRAHERYKELS